MARLQTTLTLDLTHKNHLQVIFSKSCYDFYNVLLTECVGRIFARQEAD